ncbi:protein of unknown function [Pseudodesulfovibrio profundus]|uniref:Uncharacterized protein n=1 Tax=Pseudodesulfovibrio profundus TaxID=57320 RepID=A0A2C8F6A7_9BACT|nr:hypothetical protein [Pseudodesulfovibrio profundus]SOB57565.1 protein of unknown function [Pseudodesulfovibrio profundus]
MRDLAESKRVHLAIGIGGFLVGVIGLVFAASTYYKSYEDNKKRDRQAQIDKAESREQMALLRKENSKQTQEILKFNKMFDASGVPRAATKSLELYSDWGCTR